MTNDDEREEADYTVGFGKPPKQHQFQPGQSGNNRGKPQGRTNLVDTFKKIACTNAKVRIDGKARRMTVAEAVLLSYYQLAVQGDQKAVLNLVPLANELDSLPDRAERERPSFLTPDGQVVDWFKPSYDRFTKLLNERRELIAELRRRRRMRAEKMRRDAELQDTRDPLA